MSAVAGHSLLECAVLALCMSSGLSKPDESDNSAKRFAVPWSLPFLKPEVECWQRFSGARSCWLRQLLPAGSSSPSKLLQEHRCRHRFHLGYFAAPWRKAHRWCAVRRTEWATR
jgi:hypothetical protein